MDKYFFFKTNFNFKRFLSYLPSKQNILLDFGCGDGIYTKDVLTNNKIKLIYMTDKNKKLKLFINKKYKNNKKVVWTDTINKKYDVVLLNSVSQYLKIIEYNGLMNFFFKKKVKTIVISDIPKYPRIIEAFILMITNPIHLLMGLSYLKKKEYLKMGYYFKNKETLKIKNNNYAYTIKQNLSINTFSRYTIVINKK